MNSDLDKKNKLCRCFHVYDEDIKKVVDQIKICDFYQIQKATFCSTGCGNCESAIKAYLEVLSLELNNQIVS